MRSCSRSLEKKNNSSLPPLPSPPARNSRGTHIGGVALGDASEGINNSDRTAENNRIKEILFGSLLGDGRLEMSPRSINARFGFTQSEEHKDYFIWVVTLLSSICRSKHREYSYVDKRTGKTYKSLNF